MLQQRRATTAHAVNHSILKAMHERTFRNKPYNPGYSVGLNLKGFYVKDRFGAKVMQCWNKEDAESKARELNQRYA